MMKHWFTADHHFGHANIIKYSNRPFNNVWEMDTEMIERWNSVVDKDDIVYYVGDFTLGNNDAAMSFQANLNGLIYFMAGSHDSWMKSGGKNYGSKIRFLPPLHTVTVENQPIVLCHYSLRSWDRSHYASWHLFGHHHGNLEPYGLSFDIGVDCWNFYPVSFEQVKEKMATLKPIVDYSKKK